MITSHDLISAGHGAALREREIMPLTEKHKNAIAIPLLPSIAWDLLVQFDVRGTPAPGGSKTAIPMRYRDGRLVMKGNRPILKYVDAGKENRKWRKRVGRSAKVAYQREPVTAACKISFLFRFERPQSHFRTGKFSGVLRPDAPMLHTQKPDLSKLIRSTEDSLSGLVYADDCQIPEHGEMRKDWCKPGEVEGATITIWREREQQTELFGGNQ